MAEEWTFVSHSKKTSKHRRRGRNHGKGPETGGLYRASVDGVTKNQVGESNSCDYGSEQIKNDILAILNALEDQLHSGHGFATRLIQSTVMAASRTDAHNNDSDLHHDGTKYDKPENYTINKSQLQLREIVAYGIGNFASGRFQAPMLQLACLLLLRRFAAGRINRSTKEGIGEAGNGHNDTNSFEIEQRRVPIFYFEPIMLPVEKELLETTFHIQLIESNEMGKRTVESMRQQHHLTVAMNKTRMEKSPEDTELTQQTKSSSAYTLFYMPHCPMRLYCNVLWSHWDHIFPINDKTMDEPILIFGNSFLTYDERTISSEKRADPTNGIFQIVTFAKEISVSSDTGNRNSEIVADSLRHLGVAFNDSNVISFSLHGSDSVHVGPGGIDKRPKLPHRPNEWIASEDPNHNGELV
mmetsp:Transcript_40368/g.84791  ORF Transcript_40368/g.84791 Transcript_40368/m.84791 type:complete len:412 (-) Transcript_40368:3368-4603(-)